MRSILVLLTLVALPAFADDAADKKVARLWKAKCSACHGADGRGQTESGRKLKVPDFTTAEWQKKTTDEHIRERVTNGFKEGEREMPSFKAELSPEHLDAVVALVRKLATP